MVASRDPVRRHADWISVIVLGEESKSTRTRVRTRAEWSSTDFTDADILAVEIE